MAIPDLTNAIVKITSAAPDNGNFGTAFIVARDERGDYLLTCQSLVDAVGDTTILADGSTARLIACGSADGFDLAALRVEPPLLSRHPLRLRVAVAQRLCGQFVTRGHYSLATQSGATIYLSATVTSQIDSTSHTELHGVPMWWLDLPPDAKHLLQPGYSGAPLIEITSGAVVGIISLRFEGGRRGLAISTQAIPLIWPDHPANLFAAPAAQWPEPIINLDAERAAFDDIVSGKDRQTRLILVHGDSGMGKSHLVSMYEQIAEAKHCQTILIDLKEQIGVDGCLARIVSALGGVKTFPQFHAVKMELTKTTNASDEEKWELLTGLFLAELDKYSAAQIVLLFDAHDRDKPEESLKQWLSKILLPQLAHQDKLVVIVAGQETVILSDDLKLCHYNFHLKGVSVEEYKDYANACAVSLPLEHIKLLHEVFQGKPSQFAYFIKSRCDNVKQQEVHHAG